MEEQKTLEELKRQFIQQYGLTEEQLDNILATINMLWEVVTVLVEKIAAVFQECAERYASGFKEAMKEFDPSVFVELIEQIQEEIEEQQPPPYDRTDTRNAQYNARLKGYKNKYMRSAAIRAPKRTARSCC